MQTQLNKYTIEELADRSQDFETLIDLLVEFTSIPHRLRNLPSERAKLAKLSHEIHEIVRVNRKPYQNNVTQQELFSL